jgi:hypothetical protein
MALLVLTRIRTGPNDASMAAGVPRMNMIEAAAPVLRSNQQRFAVRWARPTTRRSRAAPGATGGERDIYYLQTITAVRARLAETGTPCAEELVERGNALEANRTFFCLLTSLGELQ